MARKFYERSRTETRRYLKKVLEILDGYDVKYDGSTYLPDTGGTAHVKLGVIAVSKEDTTLRYFLSCVFHELAHILDYRDGLFRAYYEIDKDKPLEEIERGLRCGLRAEIHTDKRGERMMNSYFPKIPFQRTYRSKRDREWFQKFYVEPWKRYIKAQREKGRTE